MEKEDKDKPEKKVAKSSATGKKKTVRQAGSTDKGEGATDSETIAAEGITKTLYRVKFFYEWCKSCGICSALCPKSVILLDEQGRPFIDIEDNCIGCRNCEIHCPDFAITVKERHPERRKTNGTK